MKVYEENILLEARKKRLAALSEDVQRRLEEYGKRREMTDELILIKRKRPKLEKGDVFVVQPKEGLYFYGRVLDAHVDVFFRGGPEYAWKDSLIVCLYRNRTTRLTLDDFKPSYDDLLVRPSYVVPNAFYSGYLYKIGNVPFTKEEEELDYGFFSISFRTMQDAHGRHIDYVPKMIGISGIGNFGSLAFKMREELIIDPSLLDTTGMPEPGGKTDALADGEDEEEAGLSEAELVALRTYRLRINARLMPFDRGDAYEDPLDEALAGRCLGRVVGSGTVISERREPQASDIEIELADAAPESEQALIDELGKRPLPKGSILYRPDETGVALGTLEGIALYFNNTDLPEEVYRSYNINHVVAEIDRRIEGIGRRLSHWESREETAVYLYGSSFDSMSASLEPLIESHPLCQKCRIEQIA